jgi:hypothetical protein
MGQSRLVSHVHKIKTVNKIIQIPALKDAILSCCQVVESRILFSPCFFVSSNFSSTSTI